jgi:uncharacterized protein (DUF58 family)
MLWQQPSDAFWRRHPVLITTGLLCGAWLLVNGWFLTVGVLAATILAAGIRRRRRARTIRHAGLRARAELEHRFVLNGDPRGTYGRYPPAFSGQTFGL